MVDKVFNASGLIKESGREVYSHLMDDESKKYYEKRIMYWLTGDLKYLLELIEQLPQSQTWEEYVSKCKPVEKELIVYGACADYEAFRLLHPEVDFYCFCDRDLHKQKNGWFGKKVISPEELISTYKDHPVLINASDYYEEIEEFLQSNGFPPEKIYNKGKDITQKYPIQYFDEEIMVPQKNEVFIDGGCYDLNTARRFAKWCRGEYKKIYSFEPDPENYERCTAFSTNHPLKNLVLINKGLWDKKDVLRFHMNGEGSAITDKEMGTVEIKVDSIDHVVGDERVTFIKLDVEGAEMKALQGAKETIIKHHPRLAISIYHKPEDIVEIPAYILSLCPEYKFYVRHYKYSYFETVLYAL